jgi:hypothetical protein
MKRDFWVFLVGVATGWVLSIVVAVLLWGPA